MLSCREIVSILNSEEKVPLLKRAELRMHLAMCKHCSGYAKQLPILKAAFGKLFSKLTEVDESKIKKLEEETLEKLKKCSSG